MLGRILTETDITNIIKDYQNNFSLNSIGEKYNISRERVKRILINNNIALRKRTQKYYADYNIFETINTPEKAYWLGFLAADGCNYNRKENASILINISQKDIEHLEKFKKFCKTNAQIIKYTTSAGYSNNSKMCKIVLNSKKMSQDLSDKGIVPKKSLILKPPKIDKQFYLPFILGYFDGDGSISKSSKENTFYMSFVGTKEILEWICKVLDLDLSLKKRYDDDKNNYYISIGGTNKPYNVLKKLYNSCNICLTRKYEKFKILETVVLSRNI